MPIRGKNLFDSPSQVVSMACQNMTEDSSAVLFLFTSVISLFTSFSEKKCNMLAKAVYAWCFVFQHQLGFLLSPTVFLLFPRHPLRLLAPQVSPATQQMQPTQTIQPPQPTGGRRRRVVDEDPDERRRKFLERNRAAATRCRQKRKVWVMSLEKKAEELTQTNMQLQVQATVSFLRTQRPCVQLAFPVPSGTC